MLHRTRFPPGLVALRHWQKEKIDYFRKAPEGQVVAGQGALMIQNHSRGEKRDQLSHGKTEDEPATKIRQFSVLVVSQSNLTLP